MTHDQASNSTDNSTHDPLCAFAPCDCYKDGSGMHSCGTDTCQCDLIVKVRANEKAKWTHTCPDNNCCNGSPN